MAYQDIILNRGLDPLFWHRVRTLPYQPIESTGNWTLQGFIPQEGIARRLERKLKDWKAYLPDVLWLGGGFEPYPGIERSFRLNRRILEVAAQFGLPLVVVSRSPLILRDVDLVGEIHSIAGATLVIPLLSLNQDLNRRFEPGAPTVKTRLEILRRMARKGIKSGFQIIRWIPGVNDDIHLLHRLFKTTAEESGDFILVPTSPRYSKSIAELNNRLVEFAQMFNLRLSLKRYRPNDIRRENFWLTEQLVHIGLRRQLSGQSCREHYQTARWINNLNKDNQSEFWIEKILNGEKYSAVKSDLTMLLNGDWAAKGFHPAGWIDQK